LTKRLGKSISKARVTRNLDSGFQMAAIDKVENLGISHCRETEIFAESGWAHLTLAVHIKGEEVPLLVTCAKPGHVEAWVEVFEKCIENAISLKAWAETRRAENEEDEDEDENDLGAGGEGYEPKPESSKQRRASLEEWNLKNHSVDWEGGGGDY